jgi:hypothetical protein
VIVGVLSPVVHNDATIGVKICGDGCTHADFGSSQGGEAAVYGITLKSNAKKQAGGIRVYGVRADLQGDLKSEVDQGKDDVGSGEFGEC